MATAAALKKIAVPPKLKAAWEAFWEWLNRNTHVEMKQFLPAFGGALGLLIIIWLAIPNWHPPVAVDPRSKDPRAQITHMEGDTAPKPGAVKTATPQARQYNEREKQAIATNDGLGHEALLAAPIESLEDRVRLPKIADDGRRPWFVYSRPFDRMDPRPRIAVVMADMGLDRVVTEGAIENLPATTTFIFESDENATAWMSRTRNAGHEVLLSVPMEPIDYPSNDPGPGTLLDNIPWQNNLKRLQTAMAKGDGYVGLTTLTGSRFTSDAEQLKPILQEVMDRGLLWLDARLVPLSSSYAVGQELNMPAVRTDFRITTDKSIDEMNQILGDAETSARHAGSTTVLVYASPLTVQSIQNWAKGLPEKGFALAPLTAIVE